jgi:hypothetical protein
VANCHPLALDIFRALVGLLPRRLHRQQLWQLVDDPLRSVSLQMAASLEGTYLDAATVTAIADFVRQAKPGSDGMFVPLFHARSAAEHPLNADFLDSVLRSIQAHPEPFAARDGMGDGKHGKQLQQTSPPSQASMARARHARLRRWPRRAR